MRLLPGGTAVMGLVRRVRPSADERDGVVTAPSQATIPVV